MRSWSPEPERDATADDEMWCGHAVDWSTGLGEEERKRIEEGKATGRRGGKVARPTCTSTHRR
jgi:hypothetical protein